MRTFSFLAFVVIALAACGGAVIDSSGGGTTTTTTKTSTTGQAACSGLDYCACSANNACRVVYGDCICGCDQGCPGVEPCACACGGGPIFGCAPAACPGPFNFKGTDKVVFDANGCPSVSP